jgi:catechol 2,3-dioxygenase-like lactoylglutathione lyase family enzyme
MLQEVRHIGIVVKNIDVSLKFYRDLLGLEIQRTMDESGLHIDKMLGFDNVKVKTVKMNAPNGSTLVELLEFDSPNGNSAPRKVNDLGASHVAFTVSDVEKLYAKLSDSGVKFNSLPQLSPDGYAKVVFCFDPDQTPIELVQILDPSVLSAK